MKRVTMADAGALARVVSGEVDPVRLTLFSVIKNEMGFLPGWLEHHRRIGFEQFLIWDDASDDGTSIYLDGQPDVVVMRSDLSYGDMLRFTDPEGHTRQERAGIYFKIALPHLFFDGQVVGYVDADEFLILPPGVASVAEVVARMDRSGADAVVASVVEHFPSCAKGLQGDLPQGFDALMAAYPWYQPEQLVAPRPGDFPQIIGRSKTARLFDRYEVRPQVVRKGWHRLWMPSSARKAQAFQKSPRHKTPLVRRSAQSRLKGSHWSNLPPSSEIVLSVAHFVFTAQFAAKIDRARAWGAHVGGAAKYRYYAELLDKMAGVPDGFLDAQSVEWSGPEALIAADLMRW